MLGFLVWRAHGDDSFSLIYIYKIETHTVDIESAQGASLPNDGPNHAANLILTPNQTDKAMGRLLYSQVRLRPLAGVAAETGEISKTTRKAHSIT